MVGNLLVALALFSGEFDVQATAFVETRAGEAPILAGFEPEPFVAAIVTATGTLVYQEPGLSLRLSYTPRVYWAHPNVLESDAPLLLHTVDLLIADRRTKRFSLQADVAGSIGQADYATVAQLVGSTTQVQGSVPPITNIASTTGTITTRTALTRRWELDLDGRLFYWKALDLNTATALAEFAITEQKSATEQATALFQLTPRNALGFGAEASQASYSSGVDVYTVGPTVTWKVHLTPLDDLKLLAGVEYVRATGPTIPGTAPLLGPSGQAVSPVGGFELVSRVMRKDDVLILATAAAGVDYYVDPVIQTASPRAQAGLGITGIMLPDWLATVRGDFVTALRTTPLTVTAAGGFIPDETVASLTLAVQRRLSIGFFLEIGGVWAERAPAFVTPGFQFDQRQLWAFARLSWMSHPLPRQIH